MRKSTITLLAVIACFLLFVGYCINSFRKPMVGYETDASESAIYFDKVLRKNFDYEGFSQDWLVASWANGFQDHTYLYKLSIPSDDIGSFLEVFKYAPKEGYSLPVRSNSYLGPSSPPSWWKKDEIDSAQHYYAISDSYRLRYSKLGDSVYIVLISL